MYRQSALAPVDQAIDMLRLTKASQRVVPPAIAERPTSVTPDRVEKTAWKDGALQTALFEPFEILRHLEPGKL